MVVSTLISFGVGGWKYKELSGEISTLTKENKTLTSKIYQFEVAIKLQEDAALRREKDNEAMVSANREYIKKYVNLMTQVEELKDSMDREARGKKSLGELAEKKPTLIEKKINKATEKKFREIENQVNR